MTRLGQKVAIEPLDDKRVARLEDRVLTSFRAMSSDPSLTANQGPSWLATLARSMQRLSPAIAVAAVIVAVYVGVRGAGPDDIDPGRPARIASNADGTSTLDLGDAVCTIAAETAIELDRRGARGSGRRASNRRAIDFELTRGQIDCEVEPRDDRAAVVVRAGDVAVTVVGTVFQVRRDDVVHVSVSRGEVRVDVSGTSHLVGAGESWSGPAIVASAEPVQESGHGMSGSGASRDDARRAKNTERASRGAAAAGSSSDGEPSVDGSESSGTSSGAANPGAATPGAATPGAANPGSQEGSVIASGDDRARTVRDGRAVDLDTDADGARLRGKRTSRRPDSARAGRSKGREPKGKNQRSRALRKARPSRGKPTGSAADKSALGEALRLEASDPEAAIAHYRKLSLQRGPEAEFALYSLAYVYYFSLRDNRSALESLDHYQRRFTRGKHRESALWLRVRILCEGDDTEACRAAAHTYLNRFPGGRHARMAQDIINWDM